MTPRLLHLLSGGSRERVVKRCREMFDAGYFDRPQAPRTNRALTEELVVGLGRQGAEYLRKEDPYYKQRLTGRGIRPYDMIERRARTWSWRTIDHQLGVARFMTTLRVACRTAGFTLRWGGQPKLGRYVIERAGDETKRWPDAFFTILFPGEPEEKDRVYVFLEYDRKTEPKKIRERAEHYYEWWQERLQDAQHGWQRSWARLDRFQLLSVAVTEDRMVAMQEATYPIGRDPYYPDGWKSLRFTQEGAIKLEDPLSILWPIFHTQKRPGGPQTKAVSMIPARVYRRTPALIDAGEVSA